MMKEEEKIFEEWYELNFHFEHVPDPLEYVYLRDSPDFQRYLISYRYNELVELIKRELSNVFKCLISRFSCTRKGNKE